MSIQAVPSSGRRWSNSVFLSGLLVCATAFAGVQKDFFQGDDLNLPGNYNPSGLPTSSSDVILSTSSTALHLDGVIMSINTLNVTADNATYTVSNNTSTSSGSSISFSMPGGNSVSSNANDTIFIGGSNSTVTFQGTNGGSGSGGLTLGFSAAAIFDVAQATSTLNVNTSVVSGAGAQLNKTGEGILNLGGSVNLFSGTININQGVTNLLPGFASGSGTNLSVNNSAPGAASDVTLNIQTSVQFRSLFGTVTTPSNHAIINLVGTGTQLSLFAVAGGVYSGSIAGSGNVQISGGSPNAVETFSGNNTYTGTTTAAGCSLRIDGVTSGQGNYTVSGTQLMGNGTIGLGLNGTVTIQNDSGSPGRLAPGAIGAIGTLGVATSGTGGVIFRDTSLFTVDIGASGMCDLLAIAGGYIDITGLSEKLELNALSGAFDGSTYTIATFGQNLSSGTFNTVTGLPANYSVAYTSTSIMLRPVPEPGTIALAVELCGLLLGLKQLRKGKTAARA